MLERDPSEAPQNYDATAKVTGAAPEVFTTPIRQPRSQVQRRRETSWSVCSDEDLLVHYARQGTREAFEELVHRYERELYSYLRNYLHSVHQAEEHIPTVFLQVHLKCREFDPQRRFRPWLYRIATSRAIDLLHNRRWSAIRWTRRRGECFEQGRAGSRRRA